MTAPTRGVEGEVKAPPDGVNVVPNDNAEDEDEDEDNIDGQVDAMPSVSTVRDGEEDDEYVQDGKNDDEANAGGDLNGGVEGKAAPLARCRHVAPMTSMVEKTIDKLKGEKKSVTPKFDWVTATPTAEVCAAAITLRMAQKVLARNTDLPILTTASRMAPLRSLGEG